MNKKSTQQGIVYFVGAGPGDPGLLTLRGRDVLAKADVVIYDWLIGDSLLDFAPGAVKIDVGKSPRSRSRKPSRQEQEKINRLLVRFAKQGKTVVRLKGGDPLIFARGVEEALALKANRLPFEFVPGVSAGNGVPAYAGIPLTERSASSLVVFVTGHEDPSKPKSLIDWSRLAGLNGTLVFFMGVQKLSKIVQSLIQAGQAPKTLVSVIEWGTFPEQRVIGGDLRTIVKKVKAAKIESPSLVVVGAVNGFRKDLAWFDRRPLKGKTVLITRSRHQTSLLKTALEAEGARVLEFHSIEILPPQNMRPLEKAIRGISGYDWIIFTSTNGVDSFFRCLQRMKKDSRIFSACKIAVIGEATAQSLAAHGLKPDLMPEDFHSESLIRKFKKLGSLKGKRFLLPRTDIAPEYLRKELLKLGARVDDVTAYRTRRNVKERARLLGWLKQERIDCVTFTSSSTVDAFFGAVGGRKALSSKIRMASIGPITTRALVRHGRKPFCEARPHTVPGLVRALIQKLAFSRRS